MKRAIALGLIISAGLTGAAIGGEDPTIDRQAIMKNVGAATGAAAAMVKGEADFNLAAAQLSLRTMNNAALALGYLFPAGSETGNETEASPKIWEDKAGFQAAADKFATDTGATAVASVKDLDTFKAAFGAATANCGTCHKAYRVKKE